MFLWRSAFTDHRLGVALTRARQFPVLRERILRFEYNKGFRVSSNALLDHPSQRQLFTQDTWAIAMPLLVVVRDISVVRDPHRQRDHRCTWYWGAG